MEFDPPSALTRFGMFFLAGGVALIFAMWGVLKWIDKPHSPAKPDKTSAAVASASPSPTPQASRPR